MSEIKILDQYGAGPFEQQQFGTAGVEGVKRHRMVGRVMPGDVSDHVT